MEFEQKVYSSLIRLKEYCEMNEFKGYDPYDGLNSKLFYKLGYFSRNKYVKLLWIQLFKKLPINIRNYVGIHTDYNPKALGLFLSSYSNLQKLNPSTQNIDKINFFIKKILELQTKGFSGICWGYNFDWQSRAFFQPKFAPTIVASSFIANSLLDAYELLKDDYLLNIALSTCDFILNDLNIHVENDKSHVFSYSPFDKSIVFNASLLGARLLSRVYSFTGEKKLMREAKKAINYVCQNQNNDGSWSYGKYSFHKWRDSFHTGYNLECISDYMKFTKDNEYEVNLRKGMNYYVNNYFTENGLCKYYDNKLYPIDMHSVSQFIITLDKTGYIIQNKKLVDNVLSWAIDHMQHPVGYFFYQKYFFYTIRIPYMRWTQAWMFLALVTYLKHFNSFSNNNR